MRPGYWLYKTFWKSLDWLYPPSCGGCGRTGLRWCCTCDQQVQHLLTGVCPRCGQFIQSQTNEQLCKTCLETPPAFQAMRSWGVFNGPLRNAIHRLKYQKDVAMGEIFTQPLTSLIDQLEWSIDLVLPVPLSAHRLKERGYNQADCLAHPLALAIGKSYHTRALIRVKDTQSQVGLSAVQRKGNVAAAFQANPRIVSSQKVLVVDDVATTGSTIDACARALISNGAEKVYGITLARAVRFPVE